MMEDFPCNQNKKNNKESWPNNPGRNDFQMSRKYETIT